MMKNGAKVVNLSLRIFVPLIRHFRYSLKTEIEAFVTNVFFVILDSQNSTIEHKSLVVTLFEEICSDPAILAEMFLNYDCDLSAVLTCFIISSILPWRRLPNSTRGRGVVCILWLEPERHTWKKLRHEHRELRLNAMKALRQVLASLHSSIVTPMNGRFDMADSTDEDSPYGKLRGIARSASNVNGAAGGVFATGEGEGKDGKQTLVEIYDSKKKRREQESEVMLWFNRKPSAGISYASKCGILDGSDPVDMARYLLQNSDTLDKMQIGDYLGREPDYHDGFCLRVLHAYVEILDFEGMLFDDAIRYFLSRFRLPGEAQKIDGIMEKFAERFTLQNPSIFPTADVAFILAFFIIMLPTDLLHPAIKEER